MDKLFVSQGLRVEMIDYDQVTEDCGTDKVTTARGKESVLFVAEQLQFSDDQVKFNLYVRI